MCVLSQHGRQRGILLWYAISKLPDSLRWTVATLAFVGRLPWPVEALVPWQGLTERERSPLCSRHDHFPFISRLANFFLCFQPVGSGTCYLPRTTKNCSLGIWLVLELLVFFFTVFCFSVLKYCTTDWFHTGLISLDGLKPSHWDLGPCSLCSLFMYFTWILLKVLTYWDVPCSLYT